MFGAMTKNRCLSDSERCPRGGRACTMHDCKIQAKWIERVVVAAIAKIADMHMHSNSKNIYLESFDYCKIQNASCCVICILPHHCTNNII